MESARKPNSRTGVCALVCSFLSPLLLCGFVGLALVYGFGRLAEFIIPAFVVVFLTAATAVILGIACIFQTQTTRVAGIFGLVFGIIEVTALAGSILLAGYLIESLGQALGSGFGRM